MMLKNELGDVNCKYILQNIVPEVRVSLKSKLNIECFVFEGEHWTTGGIVR